MKKLTRTSPNLYKFPSILGAQVKLPPGLASKSSEKALPTSCLEAVQITKHLTGTQLLISIYIFHLAR